MCTHTCTNAGTLHRVRGLRVRPFSITLRCRQPHSVFGGMFQVMEDSKLRQGNSEVFQVRQDSKLRDGNVGMFQVIEDRTVN